MKHTIKLLTLAFMLAAILTLTGCPGPVNTVIPCTHENKKTVIETAATCTETGLEKIICADCGELIEEKEIAIDPDNHNFGDEWEITKNPTCTEKGSKTRKCSRCSETETVEIDALGHDWVLESDTATCATDGIKTYKCSRCNETRTEDSPAHHTFIAGGCDKCGTYQYADGIKFHLYVTTQEKYDERYPSNNTNTVRTYSYSLTSTTQSNDTSDIWDDYYLSFDASNYSELIEKYGNLFEMVIRNDEEKCKIPLDKLLNLKSINNDFNWCFTPNTTIQTGKDDFRFLDNVAVNTSIKEYRIVTTN